MTVAGARRKIEVGKLPRPQKEVLMMPAPILVAESVRKVYRSGGSDVTALKGLDLSIPQGEFVAVMGPSGSGKTTLLNCLSGLDEIDGGRVVVEAHSIHELSDAKRTRHRAETMGFVFQAFNLIPVFTATENVELPLLLTRVPEAEARRR
ncbi:MAG TPA: ATP-binding cassette domain-containing protein, partial [Gaiellaceae bacterium]|nr:ATP-binding cassette domain-containing protein [Gaiellaceae bacterium]